MDTITLNPPIEVNEEGEKAFEELKTRFINGAKKLSDDLCGKYSLQAINYAAKKFSEFIINKFENGTETDLSERIRNC